MSFKEKCVWYTYILLLSYFINLKFIEFCSPQSAVSLYYQLLAFFDPIFLPQYYLAFFQNVSNIFLLLAVLLFIHEKKYLPLLFWKIFLFVKIFLDILGNQYGWSSTASFFHMEARIGWLVLAFHITVYIPAYIALALYAFRDKAKELS